MMTMICQGSIKKYKENAPKEILTSKNNLSAVEMPLKKN